MGPNAALGEGIAAIDFPDLGPGAYVMGTKQAEKVGALIEGLVHFDVAGTYSMAMVINDVAQLEIGGELLIRKDWDGTPSRMGKSVAVAIEQPGWYPLQVVFYQRAGTAALQLFWKKPGQAGDVVVVPKEAYAHIAE